METDRVLSPILSVPKLKVEPQKENDSETILPSKDEKILDLLHLKYSRDESISNDKFIESALMGRIESYMEELDQKEPDLYLKESSYIKWETGTFKEIQVEYNDGNIDKQFDNKVMEHHSIKKESNNENEVPPEQFHQSLLKSEFIEQEEVHIKHEEDIEDNLNELVKPTKQTEKQTMLHQCSECSYSTIRKYDLKAHSVRHKRGAKMDWLSCQECSYKTSQKRFLMLHSEIHNNLILKCSKCPYETFRLTMLKKHQLEHEPNIQWLHCPECSFKTHLQRCFQRHSLLHKDDALQCTKCSYQAKRKDQLTIHQSKHESMDKWHSCSSCPYKTYDKRALRNHCQRRHSTYHDNLKRTKILKCSECPYESGCKYNLKAHQLIHDPNRWLQCPDCTYKASRKRYLKRHQVRHQGENAEGWHRCLECSYKTPHKDDLRKHAISHKSADEVSLFDCSQCSFTTAHKNSLNRHQLKHKQAQEIEWFFCYACSFKTKFKSYLPRHMSKHKKQIAKGYAITK